MYDDLLGTAGDWQERALCAQTDPEAFFVEKGGSTKPAKRICNRCEVKAQCLAWALETRQVHGVLGGKSDRERRKLLRQMDAQAEPEPAGGGVR